MSSRYNFCIVRTSFYAYVRNNELPLMGKLRACALQSIPGLFSKGLGTRLILLVKPIAIVCKARQSSKTGHVIEQRVCVTVKSIIES